MPRLPATYIVYPDDTQAGTPTVAQNSETGNIDFEGTDAATVIAQTFGEHHAVLVKGGSYEISSPLDLHSDMELAFEPGATLLVPNGYDQHVFGFGARVQRTTVRGGFVREIQAGGPVEGQPQRLWKGVLMLPGDSAGEQLDAIYGNLIEGLQIWDADVAIELRVEHALGWVNGNVFRDMAMWRCNGFISFEMSDEIAPTGANGINRNLFSAITCQVASPEAVADDTSNTTFGFRGIRDRGNAFLDVKLIDLHHNPDAVSTSIHPDARDTLIMGGAMAGPNFDDQGERTQILDLIQGQNHRQLFLNRLTVEGGNVVVRDGQGQRVFFLHAGSAVLTVGSEGNDGDIVVQDGRGERVFLVQGQSAALQVGAPGNDGDITVRDGEGRSVFNVDGRTARLRVGSQGHEGDIIVRDGQGRSVFEMDGSTAHLRVGAEGNEGDLTVQNGQGERIFHVNGQTAGLRLGANGSDGDLRIFDSNGNVTIHLDGQTGTVQATGEDCAENFEVAAGKDLEAGTVMVLGEHGRLQESTRPYDRKVAGVISGGGDCRPGLVLGGRPRQRADSVPLALTGKVWCKVDATSSPVTIGDLLTTSATPGHAMKADDPARAFGAVLGKALRPAAGNRALIPILVALQ